MRPSPTNFLFDEFLLWLMACWAHWVVPEKQNCTKFSTLGTLLRSRVQQIWYPYYHWYQIRYSPEGIQEWKRIESCASFLSPTFWHPSDLRFSVVSNLISNAFFHPFVDRPTNDTSTTSTATGTKGEGTLMSSFNSDVKDEAKINSAPNTTANTSWKGKERVPKLAFDFS